MITKKKCRPACYWFQCVTDHTTSTKSGATQIEHERYSFSVPSTSEPEYPRRVEIDAFDFWGDCFCKGHDAENGSKPGALTRHYRAEHKIGKPSTTWCCHIRAARKFFIKNSPDEAAAIQEIKPR